MTLDPSFKVKLGSLILKVPITCYKLLVPKVWDVKATYRKTYPANLLMMTDLTFEPSFKVKLGSTILKVPITFLVLVLEVWDVLKVTL